MEALYYFYTIGIDMQRSVQCELSRIIALDPRTAAHDARSSRELSRARSFSESSHWGVGKWEK